MSSSSLQLESNFNPALISPSWTHHKDSSALIKIWKQAENPQEKLWNEYYGWQKRSWSSTKTFHIKIIFRSFAKNFFHGKHKKRRLTLPRFSDSMLNSMHFFFSFLPQPHPPHLESKLFYDIEIYFRFALLLPLSRRTQNFSVINFVFLCLSFHANFFATLWSEMHKKKHLRCRFSVLKTLLLIVVLSDCSPSR